MMTVLRVVGVVVLAGGAVWCFRHALRVRREILRDDLIRRRYMHDSDAA